MVAAVAALLALGLRLAVAQPRCRAYEQYQETNMIFRCYGSTVHGDSDSQNRFIVAFAPNTEKTIAVVPKGTVNFSITMKPDHAMNVIPGQLLVENGVTGENSGDQLREVALPAGSQDRLYEYTVNSLNGSFKVSYWEHLGNPRSQRIVFHGASTVPMKVKARNKVTSKQLFHFDKFHYDAYRTGQEGIEGAPMCALDAMADGCKPYNQVWVRQHAVAFCTDVKNKFASAELAWQGMAPDPTKDVIPYYHWEEVWLKVSQDVHNYNGRNMWKVYKFLTHGGFEQDVLEVEKAALEYCYRLESVNVFAKEACDYFVYHYNGADQLWQKATELAAVRQLSADSAEAAEGEGAGRELSVVEPEPEAAGGVSPQDINAVIQNLFTTTTTVKTTTLATTTVSTTTLATTTLAKTTPLATTTVSPTTTESPTSAPITSQVATTAAIAATTASPGPTTTAAQVASTAAIAATTAPSAPATTATEAWLTIGCSWNLHLNATSSGGCAIINPYECPSYNVSYAKELCLSTSECKAVSCQPNGNCQLRKSSNLTSGIGETSYLPADECYPTTTATTTLFVYIPEQVVTSTTAAIETEPEAATTVSLTPATDATTAAIETEPEAVTTVSLTPATDATTAAIETEPEAVTTVSLTPATEACPETAAEKNFRMWGTHSCQELQTQYQTCTNANDGHHAQVMAHCPWTCAKARNEPCPYQSTTTTAAVATTTLKATNSTNSTNSSKVTTAEQATTTSAVATTTLQGTVTTFIKEDVPAGATTVKLTDVSGLKAGMLFTISGNGRSETKTIVSLAAGSVTLDSPLQNSYTHGAAAVAKAPQTTTTITTVSQAPQTTTTPQVSTVLTAAYVLGSPPILQVRDHTGFDRGDTILIGGETVTLKSFTSDGHLILKLPLQNSYAVGTTVTRSSQHQALSPLSAIWDMVKHLRNAPADPADYKDLYLNADGYQGVLPRDLEYCWHPDSWTTPKPYVVSTTPAPTTTTRPQSRHCIDHLKKAAFAGNQRIEVEDAYSARFKGATDGGHPGSQITIGGTEEHTIFAVETQNTLLLSERIKTAHAIGTPVQSKDCSLTTPLVTLAPTPVATTSLVTTVTTTNLPTSMTCTWKAAPQCVASFSYKGATITGCTALDAHYDAQWCSDKPVFDGSFHLCEWDCPNPRTCHWKKDEACVGSFVYQGQPMNACTKFRFHTWWCSHTSVFNAQDDWRYCTWDCGCFWKPHHNCSLVAWKYKGVVRNGCITEDHASGDGWCSHDKEFSGKWSHCTKYCPEPADDYGVIPKPTSVSSTQCGWKPVPSCALPFTYEGQSFSECTKINHRQAWCSIDSTYAGRWAHCKWVCERPLDLQCQYEIGPGCLKNFSFGGQIFAGCHVPDAEHDHPWCSEVPTYTSYSSFSKLCTYGCPCYWVPDPDCPMSWTLEGPYSQLSASTTIQGCLPTNDKRAWCSTNATYSGHFRWCAWACMRMNATSGVGIITNKNNKNNFGMYAGIGAGIGAGVSALGLGTYGIVKAVEASQRRRAPKIESSATGAARLQALQATGISRKLSTTGDADSYLFTQFTSIVLIVVISLCCLVSVLCFLRRRPKSKRYSQDYMDLSSE